MVPNMKVFLKKEKNGVKEIINGQMALFFQGAG